MNEVDKFSKFMDKSDDIIEAKRCIEFLHYNGFLSNFEMVSKDIKNNLLEELENCIRFHGYSMTKPFMGSSSENVYYLMKALSKRVKNENPKT